MYPCHDCRVDTIPLEGNREYYEVLDQIWHAAKAPGYGQQDNGLDGYYLCIGCLEARIDRKLNPLDFKMLPVNNPSPWYSDRLNNRLGGVVKGTKETTAQWHPNGYYKDAKNIIWSPTGSISIPANVRGLREYLLNVRK